MEQENPKFRVYLVGFPTALPDPGNVLVTEMIRHLLPEASVLCHDIFCRDVDIPLQCKDEGDADELSVHSDKDKTPLTPKLDGQLEPDDVEREKNLGDMTDDDLTGAISTDVIDSAGDLATVSSVATGDFFTPGWIDSEAYYLLKRIQKETHDQDTGYPSKVLLAGYGFGGIIVKQAVVNANANPMFYDVAYNVLSLVFLATPHQPTDQQAWEELLLGLIRSTTESSSYGGRLSGILPELVESVSHLSHVFFRVESKYVITNMVPDDTAALETSPRKKSWTTEWLLDHDLSVCNVEDFYKMKILRSHFAPFRMLSDAPLGMLMPEEYTTYFHTLQALSPSRRIVYQSGTLDKPDDFNILKDIYGSLLRRISFDKVCGSSIQVTASKGYGKSAIVKLISQHIRREASVVVIENFPNPLETTTLYRVIVSFIHQIISQKRSLFRPIRSLMTEMLRESVWTEQAIKHLLSTIFLHARDVNFLVIVYNLGCPLWPAEVHEWWSEIPALLEGSRGCTCTFLISNDQPDKTFSNQKLHHIDLKKNFAVHKEAFINAKTNQLLDSIYGSTWRRDELAKEVKQRVISKVKTFGGSFREISALLVHLLQGLSRVTPQAIRQTISRGPQTTEELYNSQVRLLKEKNPQIYSWATTTLSWVGLAVRQLHVQELAAAVAVHLDQRDISEIGDGISMDMERDICSYTNGLVAVENGYARIPCPSARAALDQDPDLKMCMLDDYSLAKTCLHYLKIVLGNDDQEDFWEKCLSYVSLTHKTKETRVPELEFLDYASRYWPTHCLRVKQHNEFLEEDVIDFLQSKVAERWFQLYLLCHRLPPNLLSRERDDTAEDDRAGDFKPDSSGSGGSEGMSVKIGTQQSAVEMASFLGLAPVVPALLGQVKNFDEAKTTRVRRGCLDHELTILNDGSKYYLDCAILNDDVSAVAALLEADEACVTEYLPLHVASLAGSSKMVWVLLETLEDTTAVNKDGRTALHMAAISGRIDVIQMLVGEDGNTELAKMIDTRDGNFETPLLLATRMGNVDAVRFLAGLGEGRGISIGDKMDKTPAHHAVLHCPQVLDTFFTHDPNALLVRDRDGSTLLHIAVRFRPVDAVSIILHAAKDPDHCIAAVRAEDKQGRSPLDYASKNGFSGVVGMMVNKVKGAVGADALIQASAQLAAEHGHLALLEMLSKWTSGIEDRLLSAAVNGGHLLVLKHLLDEGASLGGEEEDEDMKRLILLGGQIDHGHSWAREVTCGNWRGRYGQTRLFIASDTGNVEAVKKFLKRGADPNICRDDGWSPLHTAAHKREICEALVANGANIDCQLPDGLWTPIQLAASWGSKSGVEFFLQHGADTSLENVHGSTALHLAVAKSFCDIVQVMVEHEGDNAINLDNQGAWGEGPIHIATKNNAECVRTLLKKGVNVKAKTVKTNLSCLVLALQEGMSDTFAILLGDQDSGAPDLHWDREDLVTAYWEAIERANHNLKSLKLLVNKEPWLLDEVSAEGYNGLETYMRSERPAHEEDSISIAFLDFGFNPFARRQEDLKSPFELGVISRRQLNMAFMERCIKDLPKDLRASGMGFRELRIATELNDKGAWEALKSLREDVGGETDQDDWNIDHFLYQSQPRLGFAHWKGSAIERRTRSPMCLVRPRSWRSPTHDSETRVKIVDNGLGATFESGPDSLDSDSDGYNAAMCLRADSAFPPRKQGLTYFEITIKEPDTPESKPPIICIGLVGEFTNQLRSQPGWNAWSLGYHGDDGKIFDEATTGKYTTGRKFGPGNTVGCGIDYDTDQYFFTLDGEVTFRASSKMVYRKMYPSVGHMSGCTKIQANFGETAFVWSGAEALFPGGINPERSKLQVRRMEMIADRGRDSRDWARFRLLSSGLGRPAPRPRRNST